MGFYSMLPGTLLLSLGIGIFIMRLAALIYFRTWKNASSFV